MNFSDESIGTSLLSVIVEAQLKNRIPKDVVINFSKDEFGLFRIVLSFLATFGVISAVKQLLRYKDAEIVSSEVRNLFLDTYSINSGMELDKWIKMSNCITYEVQKIYNSEMVREKQISEIGLLLISASCINKEEEYFEEKLVNKCGIIGMKILESAKEGTCLIFNPTGTQIP